MREGLIRAPADSARWHLPLEALTAKSSCGARTRESNPRPYVSVSIAYMTELRIIRVPNVSATWFTNEHGNLSLHRPGNESSRARTDTQTIRPGSGRARPRGPGWCSAAGCACGSLNSSWLPATERQEWLDRREPFRGRKPHASLPVADRPSIHAKFLRQAGLRQPQQLSR
jgi:hypothetical protein